MRCRTGSLETGRMRFVQKVVMRCRTGSLENIKKK